MIKLFQAISLFTLVTLPILMYAQGPAGGPVPGSGNSPLLANDGGELGSSFGYIISFIDSVIIPFILAIGFLVFVWGIFQSFSLGGANDEAKESGKSLIMYAIAGFVVILAFWGIVNIISGGLNLEGQQDEIESPNSRVVPGS